MKWNRVFEDSGETMRKISSLSKNASDAFNDPEHTMKYSNRAKEDITQIEDDNDFKSRMTKKLSDRQSSDSNDEKLNKLKHAWRGIKQKTSEFIDNSPLNKGKHILSNAIDDTEDAINTGIKHAGRFSEDAIDNIKHSAPKIAMGISRAIEDHPGLAAGGLAAAIAAGLGGLALRRKLKALKNKNTDMNESTNMDDDDELDNNFDDDNDIDDDVKTNGKKTKKSKSKKSKKSKKSSKENNSDESNDDDSDITLDDE